MAEVKTQWRAQHHRGGVRASGHRATWWSFDWGEIGPLFVFCAVLAWSRMRFVYFADNLGAEATMAALAECFEHLGGVPKTAFTDRMGCLKGDTVAGLVIPTPAYVRFATHYGFRPDFCEGADPESKGLVENLVGYVKSDLDDPRRAQRRRPGRRQRQGPGLVRRGQRRGMHARSAPFPPSDWPKNVELMGDAAVPASQIGKLVVRKVDRLSCVRFGSARYSVPNVHIGRQVELRRPRRRGPRRVLGRDHRRASGVVAPGETSILDEHYGGPEPIPARAVRPKTQCREGILCPRAGRGGLHQRSGGPGMTGLARDLETLCELEAAHGKDALLAALERAGCLRSVPSRRRALDHRPGAGVPRPPDWARPSSSSCPSCPTRPLSDYAIGERS